jgi:ribosomal protein S18 acetylase RimI-like enzyme
MIIRPVTDADTPAILALTAGTGFFKPTEVETLAEVLADYHDRYAAEGHRCLVWEDAGRMVGYVYHALEEMTDRTWCLWWIAVAADQQGRGLGGKLLAFVEEDVRARGARMLLVETADTPHYEPTRRFYLNRGYTVVAHVPDYYAENDGMVLFTKRFPAALASLASVSVGVSEKDREPEQ